MVSQGQFRTVLIILVGPLRAENHLVALGTTQNQRRGLADTTSCAARPDWGQMGALGQHAEIVGRIPTGEDRAGVPEPEIGAAEDYRAQGRQPVPDPTCQP